MSDRKEEQLIPVSNDLSLDPPVVDDDSNSNSGGQFDPYEYELSLDARNRALYRWTRDTIETNNPNLNLEDYFKKYGVKNSQPQDISQEETIDLDEATNITASEEELIDLDEAMNITPRRQFPLVPPDATVIEAFFLSGLEYTANDAPATYKKIAQLFDSIPSELPSPFLTILTHEVDTNAYKRSLEAKKLSFPLFEDDSVEEIAPHTACARCQHNPVNNSQGLTLLTCENCLSVQYCSLGCQDADWSSHQYMYCMNPRSIPFEQLAEPHYPSWLRTSLPNPFARLSKGLWLHDRHKVDVYALLIDSFRLRESDDYNYAGLRKKESAFNGKESSVSPFRLFLTLAENKGLMPPWWSPKKRVECLDMGLDHCSDNFHDLFEMIREIEILVIYESAIMMMQLRMFAESVLGTGPAGTNGQLMLQKMVVAEEAVRASVKK
ncbi:hypothetical protein HDV63DRAFT_402649 [Trichoderma sp. SZMC 28014]